MANSLEDIALLDAYLNDQLDIAEKKAVEDRLQADPEFAHLAEDLDVLVQGVKQHYRQQLKSDLQVLEKTLPAIDLTAGEKRNPENPNDEGRTSPGDHVVGWRKFLPKKRWLKHPSGAMGINWVIGLAAMVVMAIGIWWLATEKSPEEKLFAAYFEPTKMEQTRSRIEKNKEQLKYEATQDFNKGHFTKAIPMLKELFETHQDTISLYFMGLAQLGVGRTNEAIQSLTLYNSTYEDVRYPRINYYIGLAHLRARRYDLAISFLEKDQTKRSDQLIEEIRTLQNQSN